jgi:hypothetical protein
VISEGIKIKYLQGCYKHQCTSSRHQESSSNSDSVPKRKEIHSHWVSMLKGKELTKGKEMHPKTFEKGKEAL